MNQPEATHDSNPYQGGHNADWLRQRIGCLTASRMGDAIDRLKNGAPSATCLNYAKTLVAERMTDSAMDNYVSDAMQHGIACEPEARALYEIATDSFVQLTGFVLHPTIEFFGASPDGLVGGDGLVEFKCPTTPTFLDWVAAGVVPEKHKPQMLAQLACTGRRWVHFVAYDPRVKNPKRRMFIRKFQPTADEIAAIEQEAIKFLTAVDDLFEAMQGVQMVESGG